MMNRIIVMVMLALLAGANPASADDATIIVQSTTSTKNSGLYDYLMPMIEADTGIKARVVAVGTGAAIQNAMNCDADILLVHSRKREEKFVRDGFAERRYDVMYNDFVIIGPRSDPAGIAGLDDAAAALKKIAGHKSRFASRGDDSGTHSKELALWRMAGVDPLPHSGGWYREMGSGMGTTINAAVGMRAYTLTDRATWIKFGNKADFAIVVEGDARLFNPYGVMVVSPARCPKVNADAGRRFIDWLVSDKGQSAIAAYRVDGKPLFFPNAENRNQ